MDWFSAPDAWLSRLLIQRGLALVYLVAFGVALGQFRPLLGERGLLPAGDFLRVTRFRDAPSLFAAGYSDRRLVAVAWAGIALSLSELLTLPERAPLAVSMLSWLALWALYLSIVNVGQVFYGFGWETLLLEAGFLAVFLGSFDTAPPVLVVYAYRWLLFRVEVGAGLIKLRGDPCWRDLSCLQFHHETQPMPNGLSWWFHNLPPALHRVEVLGNHAAQLVAPFLLFLPQPVAGIGALVIIVTQLWLVLSGNFSWLNLITIVLAVSALDGSWLHRLVPVDAAGLTVDGPRWYVAIVLLAGALIAILSWWPLRNMASRRQSMNASFNPLHIVNTYGAFGSVTRVRHEIVVEGTADATPDDDALWLAYEFKGKPGDVHRRPPQVAPWHLRLDWLMWCAALSRAYARSWFPTLLIRLLENDRATLALLRVNPFDGAPPRYVRARLYRYRFTTRRERAATGAWWVRELAGDYLRPAGLGDRPRPSPGGAPGRPALRAAQREKADRAARTPAPARSRKP